MTATGEQNLPFIRHPIAADPQEPDIPTELEVVEDVLSGQTGIKVVDKHGPPYLPVTALTVIWG